jgi:hypothetical protein
MSDLKPNRRTVLAGLGAMAVPTALSAPAHVPKTPKPQKYEK